MLPLPPSPSLQQSADQFAQACKELELSARINAQAVTAVFEWHCSDQSEQSGQMVADSLSFALVAPAHLLRAAQLWCLDCEMASARERV